MKNLLTGGLGLATTELVNESSLDNIATAITQIAILVMTIISLFTKNKSKNETKNSDFQKNNPD